MKANETRVDKFLATNETTFAIPVYQRNYDWNLTQCRQLFHDIVAAGSQEEVNAHFIGSIVYVHDDVYSASGINELIIIDGQQRLTTLTLLYIALYRLARKLDNKMLSSRIHKTFLINEFAPEAEKLKLKPTDNNREALRHLLEEGTPEDFSGYSRIIENFAFFRSAITAENMETVQRGLAKLLFVDISLDRQRDNPQRIFESLNSTGLELSQADLIRNYILMGLSRPEQERIYKQYWEVIENNAREKNLNKTRISEFIRDYLTLKNKEIPNKGDVYTTFKEKYPTTTLVVLEEVLAELKSLSHFYKRLLNPAEEPDPQIAQQLNYINRLEINVAFPFLMKVYEDYSGGRIDRQAFLEVLLLVQSFTFRRFVLSLPTNALNKIFMTLYDKVSPQNYLPSIQQSLLQRTGVQRFPRDVEIANALREKDVYNIKAKNRTYLFEKLENFQNKEAVRIEGNPDLTIEHIFPQNPDPRWKLELGEEEYNFVKENYLNTIGNLTLSGNNGKLGNKSFAEKKTMNVEEKEQGYGFSRLWLNRSLQERDRWGRREIEERAKLLTKRFLKIWPLPEVADLPGVDTGEINIFEAEDPRHKKLEYAVFFNQKLNVTQVARLYHEVFKKLFELRPETFLTSELRTKLGLTKNGNSGALRQALPLGESYFIEANLDNVGKFERIKQALTLLGFEDELLIKYVAS